MLYFQWIRPSFFYFLINKPADCIICEKQIKIKHQHYSFIIFRPAVSTVSAASEIKVSGYTPWKKCVRLYCVTWNENQSLTDDKKLKVEPDTNC